MSYAVGIDASVLTKVRSANEKLNLKHHWPLSLSLVICFQIIMSAVPEK